MLTNNQLKITSTKKNNRILHSDNKSTYFTLSDFVNPFDGLWSNGFHLFHSFMVNQSKDVLKKMTTPAFFGFSLNHRINIKGYLFKKNRGLLLDFYHKPLLWNKHKNTTITFTIESSFKILEKNPQKIILSYDLPSREGFGITQYYCSIQILDEFFFHEIESDDKKLSLDIKNKKNNQNQFSLYFYYHENLENLKNYSPQIETLKRRHFKNNQRVIRHIDIEMHHKLFSRALYWAVFSSSSFIMEKMNLIGVWAGYPWFDNNWGRDTFIALPGISLVSGRYEEAWEIINQFMKYQDDDKKSKTYGKIPNVIWSLDNIMYNTGDGTPLLIRTFYEYYLYTNQIDHLLNYWHNLIKIIETNYISKKDDLNFIANADADDWMDARHKDKEPYSPRGDKQVEIQALWYTALWAVINLIEILIQEIRTNQIEIKTSLTELTAKTKQYKKEADQLKKNFKKYFISHQAPYLYDHLNSDNTPDQKIRPNILLAFYFSDLPGISPLIDYNAGYQALIYLLPRLVYEHGTASLSHDDDYFHPIHISDQYHKDAAYHNGMLWGWLSGSLIHVACRYGLSNFIFDHTKNLTNQILNTGTLGSLSELVDPYLGKENTPQIQGAFSQAWSISEYCRSFYQDYLGIRMDVPGQMLYLSPRLPAALNYLKTSIRYGMTGKINLIAKTNKKSNSKNDLSQITHIELLAINIKQPILVLINVISEMNDQQIKFMEIKAQLTKDKSHFIANFEPVDAQKINLKYIYCSHGCQIINLDYKESIYDKSQTIEYALNIKNDDLNKFPVIQQKDYLKEKLNIK